MLCLTFAVKESGLILHNRHPFIGQDQTKLLTVYVAQSFVLKLSVFLSLIILPKEMPNFHLMRERK